MHKFKIIAIIENPRDLITNATVYLFNKDNKILLPIKMTNAAAQCLIQAENKHLEYRPHTHNTTIRIIRALKGSVRGVIITRYKEKIFYSYIRIKKGRKICDIDAKPSDAMAMALRFDVPIYVKNRVCRKAGIKITRELLERSYLV